VAWNGEEFDLAVASDDASVIEHLFECRRGDTRTTSTLEHGQPCAAVRIPGPIARRRVTRTSLLTPAHDIPPQSQRASARHAVRRTQTFGDAHRVVVLRAEVRPQRQHGHHNVSEALTERGIGGTGRIRQGRISP
jgi:hypothetical protein